ncbi:MAG TPA: serine/threonine-protein kinase [Gemmataceae bacterium]|jgi:serine/threonine protein kinase
MNANDAVSLEEQFANLLAAYDEALADGRADTPTPEALVPPPLRDRLRRAWACLQRLKQDRPSSSSPPPSSPPLPLAGEIRLGRFELRRELGRGGFGIVFLAWDSWMRREVALKVPRLEAFLIPELRRRFLHEARVAAGLNHPGIVPIYAAGEAGAVCYIATAYCPGGNLAQWLSARTDPVSPRQAAALIVALAEAVRYIHEHKIWHRDIKPSNILLQPLPSPTVDGLPFTPRLTDFGLAKLLKAHTPPTKYGTVLGTPAYMAPEQAAGRLQKIGPHTDVYALGAVLYELLAGWPPFRGADSLDVLRQVSEDNPVPPHRLRPGLPRGLERICLKCLEKQPHERYARAGELAADLRRFLDGQAIAPETGKSRP